MKRKSMPAKAAKFRQWCDVNARSGLMKELAEAAGVTYRTVWRAKNGHPVTYDTATGLSAATGGEVSIKDLCNPEPKKP